MNKTTLTFYLPVETFERAKIGAVKRGLSFSDLAVRSVLALIDDNGLDRQKLSPANDEKALAYLSEEEKKKIKLFAAEKAATLSEIFYHALEQNLDSNEMLPDREKPPDARGRPRSQPQPGDKKNPFSYNLTYENDSKLRLLSAETGKSRTQLILEAIEKTETENILGVPYQEPKNVRSSMDLGPKKLAFIKNRARKMNMGASELINRVLVLL